jgi:hypothetical protein
VELEPSYVYAKARRIASTPLRNICLGPALLLTFRLPAPTSLRPGRDNILCPLPTWSCVLYSPWLLPLICYYVESTSSVLTSNVRRTACAYIRQCNFFLWRNAPQQTLRTHRSLKAYCATLWWRLLVFSVFPCIMENRWNEIDRGKPKYSGGGGGGPGPGPSCPPQIPHGLPRDRTRASAVRGRRLTAWAMAIFF